MTARNAFRLLLSCLLLAAAVAVPASASATAPLVQHELESSFNGADSPGGPFEYLYALGLDASGGPSNGDVWAGDLHGENGLLRIVKYNEDGEYAGVEIDGSTTPGGSISLVESEGDRQAGANNGIAIEDHAGPHSGDLYVTDLEHNVIDVFDEEGTYLCQITARVIPSSSECAGLAGSATPQGSFVPSGIAIDGETGILYVTDYEHDVVDEFSESGDYLGQISNSHIEEPSAIALTSTALYVGNQWSFGPESIIQLDRSGNYVRTVAAQASALTTDTATGELYLAHIGGEITAYDSDENALEAQELPSFLYLSMAINPISGKLYAGELSFEAESAIEIFNPVSVPPYLRAEAATGVSETTATLHGTIEVSPESGEATACEFEYGTTDFSHSVPCSPGPPYTSATTVSAELTGLDRSTDYQFRISSSFPSTGPYQDPIPARSKPAALVTIGHPTIADESADEIERYSATLHARINPQGYETKYRFEYVDDAHFEAEGGFASPATQATALVSIGNGSAPVTVSRHIEGLSINTGYHYRVVAINARGEEEGPDMSFETVPVARIEREWAYAHLTSARIEAEIEPFEFPTTCTVQYVDDAQFQIDGFSHAASAPCDENPGGGPGTGTGTVEVEGLKPDTEYHFRFIDHNGYGTGPGPAKTFKTFGIETFWMKVVDKEGNPYTQAGGHPYEKILHYGFNRSLIPRRSGEPVASLDAFVHDVITEQPPGETGVDEEETEKCPNRLAQENSCPPASQVGELEVEYLDGNVSRTTKPLYNIVPPEGVASRYAALEPFSPSDTSIRSGSDYGATSNGTNLTEEGKVVGLTIVVWGIPAEHHAGANKSAILRNPTACGAPGEARVRADTWEEPGTFVSASSMLPAITGCDKLEFHPAVEWQPTSTVADSPTGLKVDIHQDQMTAPDKLSYADLKDIRLEPAKGLVFNPVGADGLVGCSSEEISIDTQAPARCPEGSKIGTMEIDSPLVEHPLRGGIYMATPFDNEFDSMFAIYLTVNDPTTGVVVKLAGEIHPDAGDGQLSASFDENPQLPVEDFRLNFFGGPRSVLRTPPSCGEFVTGSTVTPWSAPQSGPPVHPTDTYRISSAPNGGSCVSSESEEPNQPAFTAGSVQTTAGAHSPYVIRLERQDGTQQIASFSVSPPQGLLGKLAGIPHCPEAAIVAAEKMSAAEEEASPPCPKASQVGSVVVTAGAGSDPYPVTGQVYVGGPFGGAEVSLAVIVPIAAGPFDLGTVVVRTPLRVDLETGRVGVETNQIPTIIDGVQLDVRTIEVKLDRPGFTVNPTNCKGNETSATVVSLTGNRQQLSTPFRASSCRRLGFKPKVSLKLLGGYHRRAHPALRAVVTMPEGDSNIGGVAVAMPPTEFLDNTHIREICTRPQFIAESCPKGSIYGHATAWSPLLDKPLSGPVYMRSSSTGLPDLAADLRGEFRLAVAGKIETGHGGIGTAIKGLPDVPVSKFVLTLRGHKRGLLQNSVDVCSHPERGRLRMEGQNGRVAVLRPLLRANCPPRR